MDRLSVSPSIRIGLLALLVLAAVACDDGPAADPVAPPDPAPPAASPTDGDRAGAGGAAGGAHPLAWVDRTPDVSLLIVGNQRGKLKPCGCSSPQLGGLERLATFFDLCRPRSGDPDGLALVSMGWTLSDTAEAQTEAKAALYRTALDLLGAKALLIGSTDLFSPALAQPFLEGPKRNRPAPPGNARLEESGPLACAVESEPLATFEVRDLTFCAASILSPDGANRLRSVVKNVYPPSGAFGRLKPRPDTIWLLSTDATEQTIEKLAASMKRLGPTVIVDFAGGAGQDRIENAELESGPFVVSLTNYGKEVGLLDLERDEESGGWRLSYHTVPLEPWMENEESVLRARMSALFDVYKRHVRERDYLRTFGTYPAPDGIGYVGSAPCARCHPGIYEEWLRSPHARALRTLRERNYHWDPECIRCHVVGFQRFGEGRWGRIESGFVDPEATPHLGGVGCESCHGPGAAHVESPYDKSLFGPGGPNRRDMDQRGCAVCHDIENSHGFPDEYEDVYRPLVDHRNVPSDRRLVEPEDE